MRNTVVTKKADNEHEPQTTRRLLAGIAAIGNGNLNTRIDVAGDDELGQLATAFNAMVQKLKQSHDHLETSVEKRTAELSQANQYLQTEVLERRRAEEQLRRSEKRFTIMADSAKDAIMMMDPEGRITFYNQTAETLFGWTAGEAIGKDLHALITPEKYHEASREGLAHFRNTGEGPALGKTLELTALRKDGTEFPIEISLAGVELDHEWHAIGIVRDITERKQFEDELKESLSLLEATLEATADGIVVTDTKSRYKNFNSQFKNLWQLPDEIIETGDIDRILAMGLTRLKMTEPFHSEVITLRGQPERQTQGILEFKNDAIIEYCSKPQYVNDDIVGRVWSFHDVTKAHCSQQKQERLLRRIAAINEELSHFAYVVSHDLKAPLRGIRLLTEWLCTDYSDQLGAEAKENLDLLQNRVDRMYNLIEGVLQYSRVGRIKEDKTDVDLNELLPQIIDTIAPPEHVTICVEGPLPNVEGEPTRITQVFQNLLSNAVKYMDKPVGRIVVACEDAGEAWRFRIADNGPGIEERYFDRIFKIFQTLTSRDEFESTGVGLTLVKKIVELYGGKIWLESELGQGSTFYFTLPKHTIDVPDAHALAGAAMSFN